MIVAATITLLLAVLDNDRLQVSLSDTGIYEILSFVFCFYIALLLVPLYILPQLVVFLGKRSRRFDGTFHVTITDTGITSIQTISGDVHNELQKDWDYFNKWNDSEEFIFLYHLGQRAFIPKSAFDSEASLKHALQFFEEHPKLERRKLRIFNNRLQSKRVDFY